MADGDTSMIDVTRALTDGEVASRKDELVAVDSEIDDLEDQRKAAAQEFKGKLEPRRDRRRELIHAIETGRETLEVECVEAWDYRRNVVEIKRRDTGEVVEERAMDGDERQEDLTAVKGGRNRGKAAKSEPPEDDGDDFEGEDESA
jgi:hypothetical protein